MQEPTRLRPSAIALVAANLVPLIGVLAFGWRVFDVMVIYWAENVIIGMINVLKIICCGYVPEEAGSDKGEGDVPSPQSQLANRLAAVQSQLPAASHLGKPFLVPFFTVHYGIFCLVHGVFVFTIFGSDWSVGDSGPGPNLLGSSEVSLEPGIMIAILAFGASHLFSFVKNYLIGGEYRRTSLPELMFQPYGRVVVLHLAILLGGFATVFLGSHVVSLLILVVGKIVIDLKFHLAQHREPAG